MRHFQELQISTSHSLKIMDVCMKKLTDYLKLSTSSTTKVIISGGAWRKKKKKAQMMG